MNPRIERLRAIHRLETAAEMEEYDRVLSELAEEEPLDPALLPDLFASLYDDTEGEEVMWGLLHLVEDFPSPGYASALIEALPQMVTQAREWSLRLLMRMLNSATERGSLRDAYRAHSPELQSLVRELLQEIVSKNKSFTEKAAQITS
jgi:hypothetical protein